MPSDPNFDLLKVPGTMAPVRAHLEPSYTTHLPS
jgi:hypothetical protein